MVGTSSCFNTVLEKHPAWAVLTLGSVSLVGNPERRGIFRQALTTLDWENEKRSFFFDKAFELQCSAFIDVGANYGLYTIDAVKRQQFEQVWAFEPDQENLAILRCNLEANASAGSVRIYVDALSDTDGLADFLVTPDSGWCRLARPSDAANERTALVATRALDSLGVGTGKRIAIKIDVEGSELRALRGMKQVLLDNECFLQIESWDAGETTAFLMECGYEEFHQIEPEPDHYYRKIGMAPSLSSEAKLAMVLRKAETLNGRMRANDVRVASIRQQLASIHTTTSSLDARIEESTRNANSLDSNVRKFKSDIESCIQNAVEDIHNVETSLNQAILAQVSLIEERIETVVSDIKAVDHDLTASVSTLKTDYGSRSRLADDQITQLESNHDVLARECVQEFDRLSKAYIGIQDTIEQRIALLEKSFRTELAKELSAFEKRAFKHFEPKKPSLPQPSEQQKRAAQRERNEARTLFTKSSNSLWRRLCRFVRSPFLRPVAYLRRHNLVDPHYYWTYYPETMEHKISAAAHYYRYGAAEGKNPSATFNTNDYLLDHPEVCRDGINPLVHAGLSRGLKHK